MKRRYQHSPAPGLICLKDTRATPRKGKLSRGGQVMMAESKDAERATWALFAAGAAWPSAYGALTFLAMSPLERTLSSSWCGAAPHAALEFLGHCPACWTGASAFMLAGAALLLSRRNRQQGAT
jgi:hypothetical protein